MIQRKMRSPWVVAALIAGAIPSYVPRISYAMDASSARNTMDFETWFKSQIRAPQIRDEASDTDPDGDGGNASSDDGLPDKFFLNVSPSVTFGFRGNTDITIAPEVEFIWEKSVIN